MLGKWDPNIRWITKKAAIRAMARLTVLLVASSIERTSIKHKNTSRRFVVPLTRRGSQRDGKKVMYPEPEMLMSMKTTSCHGSLSFPPRTSGDR